MSEDTPRPKQSVEDEEASSDQALDEQRGRSAARPASIPLLGWKDILLRTKVAVGKDHLSIVAAGVAFFLLLGIIPALAALLMLYAYISDPADLWSHFESARHFLPKDAHEILLTQMEEVVEHEEAAGIGALLSILFALWAGSRATKGLTQALNIAYAEDERRGFIKRQLITFCLTVALIVIGIVSLLLVAGLPAILSVLPLTSGEERLASWLRWPILFLMITFCLAILYRFGPSRRQPKWRWVSLGSIVVTFFWLLASAAFSIYVSNFGSYNETYGSLGAAVILLMWLYLTAFLILLGAEINAEMEHQTAEDTTWGKPRPMGKRGAYMADHIGKSP